MISMLIPSMSAADHANVFRFCLRNDIKSCMILGGRSFPILTRFSGECSSRVMELDMSFSGSRVEGSRTRGRFVSLVLIWRNSARWQIQDCF